MRCANPVRSYNAFFRQHLTIQVPPEVPPENRLVRISSYHDSSTLVLGRHVSDIPLRPGGIKATQEKQAAAEAAPAPHP